MTWNYRVTKRKILGEKVYEIREVYYDKRGEIKSYTADAIDPCSTTKGGLRDELARMLAATYRGAVDLDELEANRSQKAAK